MSTPTLKECVEDAYSRLQNYRIDYASDKKNSVAIYVSSNGIYFPNTVDCFTNLIFNKDRYELTRLKVKRADKHIFIRDLHKHWYVEGINSTINSVDKLVDWLKKEVEGYSEIIVIGISAAGYLATLLGVQLKASIIFDMNGSWNITMKPALKKLFEEKNENLIKYQTIATKEYDQNNVFYFVSLHSPLDIEQIAYLKDFTNIHWIKFVNSHHGVPFLKCALPRILNMTYDELLKLKKGRHYPILFEIRYAGLFPTIKELFITLKKKLLRKA